MSIESVKINTAYHEGQRKLRGDLTVKSAEIKTPVWRAPLAFHEGGIIRFQGPMESSKTRAMLAVLFQLLNHHGYDGSRVFANCWLEVPGSRWLRNEELRQVLRRAFNTETGGGRWNKCIFMVMEADDVWSHITQTDKECFFDLKKASQSYKRNMYLMYEVHEGLSVPKYLRDKTEISVRPVPDEKENHLDMIVCNGHYDTLTVVPIDNISWVNDKYRRFDELY